MRALGLMMLLVPSMGWAQQAVLPAPLPAADDGECTVTTTVRCTGAAAPYAVQAAQPQAPVVVQLPPPPPVAPPPPSPPSSSRRRRCRRPPRRRCCSSIRARSTAGSSRSRPTDGCGASASARPPRPACGAPASPSGSAPTSPASSAASRRATSTAAWRRCQSSGHGQRRPVERRHRAGAVGRRQPGAGHRLRAVPRRPRRRTRQAGARAAHRRADRLRRWRLGRRPLRAASDSFRYS